MRMAFATCVQLGLSCIEEIFRSGGNLDLMITLRDDKATHKSGRIYLDSIARTHNIPLLKINNINDSEVIQELRLKQIDWLFIIGWSQIAKAEILSTPSLGCIGMHPTLLPKGRGRAAIPWAILKGLQETGVTMFKLDEGVDTGPIIGQITIPIEPKESATTLYNKVNDTHVKLMSQYWRSLVNNEINLVEQNEDEATYWAGRKPEDGEITSSMSMIEADRMVRAVTKPYPGSFCMIDGQKLTIWEAVTSNIRVADHKLAIPLRDGYLYPTKFDYS